ncbi:MAG: WYL domain-containing protein [bacterium]|nr:WYL domain-containing protein [bacterium]
MRQTQTDFWALMESAKKPVPIPFSLPELIALYFGRDVLRIFVIDRIKMINLTGERFEVPADFDADEFMKAGFGIFQGQPTLVKVQFTPDAAGYVREKIWQCVVGKSVLPMNFWRRWSDAGGLYSVPPTG